MEATQNAIMVDLDQIPQEKREALQREAVRRGVPLEQIIRDALLDRPCRILRIKPPTLVHRSRPRTKATA